MTDYSMQRAYDLGHARGAIRIAIVYLENASLKDRALKTLKTTLAVLDANEKARIAAIFPSTGK